MGTQLFNSKTPDSFMTFLIKLLLLGDLKTMLPATGRNSSSLLLRMKNHTPVLLPWKLVKDQLRSLSGVRRTLRKTLRKLTLRKMPKNPLLRKTKRRMLRRMIRRREECNPLPAAHHQALIPLKPLLKTLELPKLMSNPPQDKKLHLMPVLS